MPGHKRKGIMLPEGPAAMNLVSGRDFTELPGLDDLNHPDGAIKLSQQQAAEIFGAGETRFLVGGSTEGILSAVTAAHRYWEQLGEERGSILIARNCHKSVYNAARLSGLMAVPVEPVRDASTGIYGPVGGGDISGAAQAAILKGKKFSDIAAVVITSPTYEGVMSDIEDVKRALTDEAERRGCARPLIIVDEAHGAHLPFMGEAGIRSSIAQGADIVIQSVHKTLPALTQTALLHIARGGESGIDRGLLTDISDRCLRVFRTSSPSYVLMESIEDAIIFSSSDPGMWSSYIRRLGDFREKCGELQNLELFRSDDPSRLTFILKEREGRGITGKMAAHYLERRFGIAAEMSAEAYFICISTVMDSREDLMHLLDAQKCLDSALEGKGGGFPESGMGAAQEEAPGIMIDTDSGRAPLKESAGRVSRDFIYVYPPGSGIIMPGDIISDGQIRELLHDQISGYDIYRL